MDEIFYVNYYGQKYYGGYQSSISPGQQRNTKRAKDIFSIMSKLISKKSSILEVGAGRGDNLLYFKNQDFVNLFATEVNNKAVSFLNQSGIKCFQGTLQQYTKKQKNKFDLIILSHVLEHFVEPNKALHSIRKLLKNTGKLFILVPKLNAPGNTYSQFTLPHISYFTQTSLHNLLIVTKYYISKAGNLNSSELFVICNKTNIMATIVVNEYTKTSSYIRKLPKLILTKKEILANIMSPYLPELVYEYAKKLILK
jgi:2-polyprenyl-3-methyl-5-hydroxy-6-metoxy-1,4-benzoquinol methylase